MARSPYGHPAVEHLRCALHAFMRGDLAEAERAAREALATPALPPRVADLISGRLQPYSLLRDTDAFHLDTFLASSEDAALDCARLYVQMADYPASLYDPAAERIAQLVWFRGRLFVDRGYRFRFGTDAADCAGQTVLEMLRATRATCPHEGRWCSCASRLWMLVGAIDRMRPGDTAVFEGALLCCLPAGRLPWLP